MFFSWLDWGDGLREEDHRGKVPSSSHHIQGTSMTNMISCCSPWSLECLRVLLLLLLLSRFSRVWLCMTQWTAAHQAPPSLGFSRQELRSGLPFPSPMHESEKWKWSCSVVSNSSRPHGLQPTRLLCPWDFPGKSTGVGYHCFLKLYNSKILKFINSHTLYILF